MQNTNDNFFSMDRLVEFGMGMAMSQQIVQNMNNMMESMRRMPQMQVAAQPLFVQQPIQPLLPPPLPEVYYIAQGGRQAGPYSGTEIARLVIEKQVSASTPVWKSGLTEWKTAADFTELVALIALVPPAAVPASAQDIAKES